MLIKVKYILFVDCYDDLIGEVWVFVELCIIKNRKYVFFLNYGRV